MKIKYTLLILLLSIIGSHVFAQSHKKLLRQEEVARKDAKNFKLSKSDLKIYRKGTSGRTSDYFKPRVENVSDTSLLKDSTYVKTFRNFAYSKTSHRKGAGEYVIIAGAIVVLAGISALITL